MHKLRDNLRIFHELAGPVFPPPELRSTYLVQVCVCVWWAHARFRVADHAAAASCCCYPCCYQLTATKPTEPDLVVLR